MTVSHQEGLLRDLKGGKGVQGMLAECGFEMSECDFRWLFRRHGWWLAQRIQRRANRALSFMKSLPDTVRCGVTESRIEAAEGLPFIAAEYRLLEKLP